jgi:hypothetical protein
MFINKSFADISIGYEDWMEILNNLWKSNFYCKSVWRIDKIETNLNINSECISDYKIYLQSLDKKNKFLIKSYWVQKWDEKIQCGNEVWIYSKINWKIYNPQLWDYIIAKVNQENSYINELYSSEWKSIDDLASFSNSINIPYCSWSLIKKEEIENNKINLSINILYWISVFLILVICILIFKIYSHKKK